MKKEILIKIEIDTEKDEIGNVIHLKGFDKRKQIQNRLEVAAHLDLLKLKELIYISGKEVKD